MDGYFTITPLKQIQTQVHKIMVFEKTVLSGITTSLPFYADGYPGLIFQQSDGGMLLNNANEYLPEFFLYGQTVKPITLSPTGSYRMIVFVLYPASINTLFGIRSSEIRDSCVDLRLIPGSNAQFSFQSLSDGTLLDEQISVMTQYIFRKFQSSMINPDNIIDHALRQISQANGQASLSRLRSQLNITERTFERRFEQLVGVSPKLFSRICQFKSTLQQLDSNDFTKLSDLAYDNGYSDQSHFIRSFKEFTGKTPLEYLKENSSQYRYMAESITSCGPEN